MDNIIGVDIGGTKCGVILGRASGDKIDIIEKRAFLTKDYPHPERALAKCAGDIESLIKGHKITAVGICCGGPLDNIKGIIQSPPNLPGWDDIPICQFFQERFSVPAYLQNDANACALAEWRYGAGKGTENFIFLTFGTGLGAGLIINSRLYAGKQCMAGEIGHWRMYPFGPVGYGKAGSLEGFCGGGGIAQLAGQKLLELRQMGKSHILMEKPQPPEAKDVFRLAVEKDPLCLEIITTIGETFGKAASMLIDLLNPQVIAGGSIFTRQYDLLYPIVREMVSRESLSLSGENCRILPSELGEEIGDIGALAVALADAGA